MRLLRPLFIAWIAITWIPGANEMVEDVVHLAVSATSVHSSGHDTTPEHGCAPTGHHCSCCASLVAVRPPSPTLALPPALVRHVEASLPTEGARPGVSVRIPRPPTA